MIFIWINEKEDGLVIQPFEISSMGKDLDGKPLAALLRFDLEDINDVWSKNVNKKGDESALDFSFPNLSIKNEALELNIAALGSVNLEGSSFSLGSMLFSMKELSGNRASTVSISLQKYNSTILAVAILEDRSSPDRTVRIFQAKKILYNNSSMIEQIPDLIDDMAYQLFLDISKRKVSQTEDLPQNWQAFKYLTQGRDAYIDYLIMNNLNDLDNASELTIRAIKFEPIWKRSSYQLSNLGFCYLERKEYEKAKNIFLNATTLDSFNRSLGLGLVYGYNGDYDRSLNELENATRLNPNSATAWYNKGVALYRLVEPNYNESIQSYENAINLTPNYPNAWFNKGCALDMLKRYDDAIKAYEGAIRNDPNYTDAWNNKGTDLARRKNYDEAIKAYDEAIRLNPNDANSWYNKGNLLEKMKEYNPAIQALDEAIKRDSRFELAWECKGLALFHLSNYNASIKAYENAIKIKSKARSWNGKGDVLKAQGKYNEAIEAYEKAIELDPKSATFWNDKGIALYNQNKNDEAIEAFDKAIELNSSFTDARSNKGLALISLGKYNEAMEAPRAFP